MASMPAGLECAFYFRDWTCANNLSSASVNSSSWKCRQSVNVSAGGDDRDQLPRNGKYTLVTHSSTSSSWVFPRHCNKLRSSFPQSFAISRAMKGKCYNNLLLGVQLGERDLVWNTCLYLWCKYSQHGWLQYDIPCCRVGQRWTQPAVLSLWELGPTHPWKFSQYKALKVHAQPFRTGREKN